MAELAERLQAALGAGYRVERELGGGGMSRVFVAEELELGRKVVVKVLPPEMALGVNADRFRREIQLSASLQHPHIVPLLAAGHSADLVWYTMPLIEGESLRAKLAREGELPVPEAVRLLRDVADALAYAHQHGVVHRDIKPDNVLLTGQHAVVTDFGVAKAITTAAGATSLTSVGLALGTPAYMAPEQATGSAQVDHRADIYALGSVAYELLTGRPPFLETTPEATLAAHVTQTPEPLTRHRAAVPGAVSAVVMRCLEKKAADRWQSSAELHAQLEALATPSGGMAPTGAVPALVARFGGRSARRVWAAAAALVMLAVLAYGAARLVGGRGAGRSVAVLTFERLSSDTGDTYLAEGLADGISTALGQVPRLTVASRTAVRRIPNAAQLEPAQLGERLRAAHLVSGTIQRAAGRLQVTVELVNARTGEQVWTARYDTTATDVLGVQAEIAEAVARNVAGRLLPAERRDLARRPTTDPVAYDHFLRGNRLAAGYDASNLPRALAEYDAALRIDTGFTAAWAAIADLYRAALNWGWLLPGLPAETLLARGNAAADRALRRDSVLAIAWRARAGLLGFEPRASPDSVVAALRRAIRLDPADLMSYEELETVLRRRGHFDESREVLQRLLRLDPRYAEATNDLALIALEFRSYREATSWLDSTVAVDPGNWLGLTLRAYAKIGLGDTSGAVRDAEMVNRLAPPDAVQAVAAVSAIEAMTGGRTQAAARIEPRLVAAERQDSVWVRDGYNLAQAAIALGWHDRAIRILEKTRPCGPWLWSYLILPSFDPIRSDPRFRKIIDKARPPGAQDPV